MTKAILITLLLTLKMFPVKAQEKNVWTAFWNKNNTLVGYKDSKGVMRIKPKYNGYFAAQRFEHIMAVSQTIHQKWNSYYLTKSGRIVGRDSTINFDNSPDCEHEGFIRFKAHKSDLVGMFNKDGNVKIPAEYNVLSRSVNGMIMALKGAKKTGKSQIMQEIMQPASLEMRVTQPLVHKTYIIKANKYVIIYGQHRI